ncbi:cilia- and flagella-associated protein 251-like isoform X2 [Pomacea canaliculata]|uniref:cilia- and flagella-associated protein 251-like isoform X2 n=1 Tax=Pomacea canaliculata TaxID=400727 RepID=UPI000D72D8B2|nr:cilia- and flagella-associated protein 251-like isoform X2 [Pomacea canaliculata]
MADNPDTVSDAAEDQDLVTPVAERRIKDKENMETAIKEDDYVTENEFEDSEEKVEELGKETQEEDDVADVQSQNEKLDDDGQELKEEALISELGDALPFEGAEETLEGSPKFWKVEKEQEQDQGQAIAIDTSTGIPPPYQIPPSPEASHDTEQQALEPEASSRSFAEDEDRQKHRIPSAPHLPSSERPGTSLQGTMSSCALNIVWSFGLNKNIPVLNLTDGVRKAIMYACSHIGVVYDFENNKQFILQAHLNPITCVCVSEDKRWLVTGDKGVDSMVNVWDTYTCTPIQTLFEDDPEGGVVALALTPDARYLATLSTGPIQYLKIWDWTIDGEIPLCCAKLNPVYGFQNYVTFNAENIHHVVSNSETQIIFYHWEERFIEYFVPPLTDEDFNRPVGRYSQSVYMSNSSRALTATSIGNLVVWDNNKPLTKVISTEQSADKKPLKIVRVQERGINVLTTAEKYIVTGDQAGHVKFFDQDLKLIYWYQHFNLGPITSVSFAANPRFQPIQNNNYPSDTTIARQKFVVQDFVVGTSIATIGSITADGSKVKIIQNEHDAAVHGLSTHPYLPLVAIGSYSGLLKIWNYETKETIVSQNFESGNAVHCFAYDPKGAYLVVGFTNGTVRVLDSLTLKDELAEPFNYARGAITHIAFSPDSLFFATADAQYTTSLYKAALDTESAPFVYIGRYHAHYRPIKELLFGFHLDSNKPRLLSLGADRMLVEYDLENTVKDNIVLASSERLEQSSVPTCMTWYPALTKEHFILTANDQFKFKLYNASTKMCRKTLLAPTYGSPVQKMAIVPSKVDEEAHRYVAYITDDKVGLLILPLDGNPHNTMALIAHPTGVTNLVVSHDGRYLFTAGGLDATVHMWEVNINALEAQARLGGEGLLPFYGLMEGGHNGELFSQLEDFFYYAQIRSQGANATETRQVSTAIPLAEVPFVMRALGFYPTEQEIEDMINEVKFSQYVETGQYVEEVDLETFIRYRLRNQQQMRRIKDSQ